MIVRSDVAQSLVYGSKAQFLSGRQSWPSKRSLIAAEAPSTGKSEKYVGLGAQPMPIEARDKIVPRGLVEHALEIVNKDWETTLGVSHDAINDDRVGHVLPWMMKAGQRFEQHMDKLCFQAMNAGDAATYGLCYDGLYYFSASHADPGADYTTVQSNLGTSTLTLDTFNTIWVAAKAFMDDRGEVADIPFDLLIVPPALRTVAAQICDNENAYDTANREVNPFKGEIRYVVNPYMGSTSWVLACSAFSDKPIIFQLRQSPELVVWDDESVAAEGGERFFKWTARYQVGYGDWRLAYMGKT
jgi:phage major head subunit gpT-like protein